MLRGEGEGYLDEGPICDRCGGTGYDTKEIVEAAKKQLNMELDKKKMVLKDPIKSLGTYEVQIKLHPKVTGSLIVHVSEE